MSNPFIQVGNMQSREKGWHQHKGNIHLPDSSQEVQVRAHTCRKGGPAKPSAEERSAEWTPDFWTVSSQKTGGASVSPGIPDPQPGPWPSRPRGLSIQEGGPGRWVDRATGEAHEDHLETLCSQAGPDAAELHRPSFTETRQIL